MLQTVLRRQLIKYMMISEQIEQRTYLSIPFNENRLYGSRKMVAAEPVCVFA